MLPSVKHCLSMHLREVEGAGPFPGSVCPTGGILAHFLLAKLHMGPTRESDGLLPWQSPCTSSLVPRPLPPSGGARGLGTRLHVPHTSKHTYTVSLKTW